MEKEQILLSSALNVKVVTVNLFWTICTLHHSLNGKYVSTHVNISWKEA